MVTYLDEDYQQTKLIKQGKAFMNPDFKPLDSWIKKHYDLQVLNIYFDIMTTSDPAFPRLNIIFENPEEELKLKSGLWQIKPTTQRLIGSKFNELVNNKPGTEKAIQSSFIKTDSYKYETSNLFVITSAFKPIAKAEINERLPQSEIDDFNTKLDNRDIWEISRFSAGVTFFFYTQQQAQQAKINGYVDLVTEEYFRLLKKYDEFDYFEKETFAITVDSKENFDNNYESNWYYYYK